MNEEKEEKKETAPQTEAPETAAADGAPKAETPAEKKPEKNVDLTSNETENPGHLKDISGLKGLKIT